MIFLLVLHMTAVSTAFRFNTDDELIIDLDAGARRCEPITVSACKYLGYNMTSVSNGVAGITSQQDAEYRLNSFSPLVRFGCSSQLSLFLCSLFVPMCSPQIESPIGPCRSLCEAVRDRCGPVLYDFGFLWPSYLNCSRFPPANDHDHMCMEGQGERVLPARSPQVGLPSQQGVSVAHCGHFAYPHLYHFINATRQCAQLCRSNVAFSAEDKSFVSAWMTIWAVGCFGLGIFTVLSFVIRSSSFKYPDRAAVHMIFCFTVVSMGYLTRLAAGAAFVTCHVHPESGVEVRVTEGDLHPSCTFVFLLLYYFGNAASLWWVMLCVSWLMKAWCDLGHDRIVSYSSWFHIGSWGIPALLTSAALLLRKVDSDELTGTCYPGSENSVTLVRFVLVPQFTYLVSGATLVLVVFACLWKKRSFIIAAGLSTETIDMAAARVGIVAVLYMVPATCLVCNWCFKPFFWVGTTFYEYSRRDGWLMDVSQRPNMEVYMLKIFMSVSAGIMAGLFLLNREVIKSWKELWRRLVLGEKSRSLHLQAPFLVQHLPQEKHHGKSFVKHCEVRLAETKQCQKVRRKARPGSHF